MKTKTVTIDYNEYQDTIDLLNKLKETKYAVIDIRLGNYTIMGFGDYQRWSIVTDTKVIASKKLKTEIEKMLDINKITTEKERESVKECQELEERRQSLESEVLKARLEIRVLKDTLKERKEKWKFWKR